MLSISLRRIFFYIAALQIYHKLTQIFLKNSDKPSPTQNHRSPQMTRETKQDRIVKTIIDPMTELFHELQNIEKNPNHKEADVEVWAQSFLKNALGFTVTNGYSIRAQESKGKMRPDLTVYNKENVPVLVV
jgi:hypothetical protein